MGLPQHRMRFNDIAQNEKLLDGLRPVQPRPRLNPTPLNRQANESSELFKIPQGE